MQARMTVHGGHARLEVVSILEDLWDDYIHFRDRASHYERPNLGDRAVFRAARYRRVALILLMSYLEGVVNAWGRRLVPSARSKSWYGKSLCDKVEILSHATRHNATMPGLTEAKELRNQLAHLKPGHDLQLYDSVSSGLLRRIEGDILKWLSRMETVTGLLRHPDTRGGAHDFAPLLEALGRTTQDAHSTQSVGAPSVRPRHASVQPLASRVRIHCN